MNRKPTLIERLRDSARHYRNYMAQYAEVFPGRSVARHVYLLEEAADELAVKADGAKYWHKQNNENAESWQARVAHANHLLAVARNERDEAREELQEAREALADARSQAALALMATDIRGDVRSCLYRIANGKPKACPECGK